MPDFSIKWNSRISMVNEAPATDEEIRNLMEKIQYEAEGVDPRNPVVSVTARSEVIKTVAEGIKEAEQGFCLVDWHSDGPEFDPENGYFKSDLLVFPNEQSKNDWIHNF